MGHIVRSMALAQMLKNDFECVFVTRLFIPSIKNFFDDSEFKIVYLPLENDHLESFFSLINKNDIVVLDNYFFDSAYQLKLKSKLKSLVCIDDLHDKHFYADIVINHAQGVSQTDYSKEEYTKLYLGFDYALLRPEFLHAVVRNCSEKRNRVLIAFGGMDVLGLNNRFIEWCILFKDEINVSEINVLGFEDEKLMHLAKINSINLKFYSGLNAKELVELFNKVDFGIFSASTIALESCALHIPSMVGKCIANQEDMYQGLVDKGLVFGLNNIDDLSMSEFNIKMLKFLKQKDIIDLINISMIKTFDYNSGDRLLEIFKML